MNADEVTGSFGAGSALRAMTGVGHAEIEQTTATGAQQTANGDRLEAEFAPRRTGSSEQGTRERKRDRGQKTGTGSEGARQ